MYQSDSFSEEQISLKRISAFIRKGSQAIAVQSGKTKLLKVIYLYVLFRVPNVSLRKRAVRLY